MSKFNSDKKIQIFPFYVPEGNISEEIKEVEDSNFMIIRSLLLGKEKLDGQKWFLTDGSAISDIIFWKPVASDTNDLNKGIELNKKGFSLHKPKIVSKNKKFKTSHQWRRTIDF